MKGRQADDEEGKEEKTSNVSPVRGLKDQCPIHGSKKRSNSVISFVCHTKVVRNEGSISLRLKDEGDSEVLHGWKVFFQYIDVDDVLRIVRKEADGFTKEDDSRPMRSSYKTKGDAQRFDRSMSFSRVFLYDNGNRFGHGNEDTVM